MTGTATAIPALNPLAVLTPVKQPPLHSLQDYLRREEQSLERHEYYNGIIKKLSMARGPHNEIAINIATAIKIAVKNADKKYRIYGSNQKIYLPVLNHGLYPDAVIICEQPRYWDDNEVLLINPLAIVEVLSKSTRVHDRGSKFDEYKTLPSFKEYVLIEQNKCYVETRFREEPDLWRESVSTDRSAHILLKSIGCSISMADIYENIEIKSQ